MVGQDKSTGYLLVAVLPCRLLEKSIQLRDTTIKAETVMLL